MIRIMKRAPDQPSSSKKMRKPAAAVFCGAPYLYKQRMELDDSDYVIEFHDDISKWEVTIPKHLLPIGLQPGLVHWAKRVNADAALTLEIRFPSDFPLSVPFVRVIRPRFQFHTGHVTIGGSICTKLLTPDGWKQMCVDALLQSILLTLNEGGARIQLHPDQHCLNPMWDYSFEEAKEAYKRMGYVHNWKT